MALSIAEAELIASVWGEQTYSEFIWTSECDDLSQASVHSAVAQLTQQLSASKTRTRRLPMREGIKVQHLVKCENVSTQLVPTAHPPASHSHPSCERTCVALCTVFIKFSNHAWPVFSVF